MRAPREAQGVPDGFIECDRRADKMGSAPGELKTYRNTGEMIREQR
jgi:hypothetical protein